MVRTNSYEETIEYLMKRARGKTESKDNKWFIDEQGRIVGHGYIQSGSQAYFPHTPKFAAEISISKATGVSDWTGGEIDNENLKLIIEKRVLDAMEMAKVERLHHEAMQELKTEEAEEILKT